MIIHCNKRDVQDLNVTAHAPFLFLFCINDIPKTVDGLVKIFANDCKTYSKISRIEDFQKLQSNSFR